jgi:hypothetical protein
MKNPIPPIRIDQLLRIPFRRPVLLCVAFSLSLVLALSNIHGILLEIEKPTWVLGMAVLILITPLFNGVFILLAHGEVQRKVFSLRYALNGALTDWPRLVIAGILSNLLVVAGLFLFLLPGIYIGLRLSFYKQAILIDRSSVTTAFRESWRRTGDWRIPLLLLLLLAPFYGLSALTVFFVNASSIGLAGEGLLLGVSTLTFAWTNTLLTSLYLSIQEVKTLTSR